MLRLALHRRSLARDPRLSAALALALAGLTLVFHSACTTGSGDDDAGDADDDAGIVADAGGDGDGDEVEDAGVSDDAGVAVGPCGPYAYESAFDGCTSSIAWSAGRPAPYRADHHATILTTLGGTPTLLYTGGARDAFAEFYDDIHVATVGTNGGISSWTKTGVLNGARAGHTIEVVNGRLYVIGGRNTGDFIATVPFAPIDDDGTIGAWNTSSANIPGSFWHHQSFVKAGAIWVIGGQSYGSLSVDTVYRGPIGDDGVIAAWEQKGQLPVAFSHHGVAATDTAIFAIGGLQNQDYTDEVYRARFVGDDDIAAWEALPTLPEVVVTPSVAIVGDGLFVVGGLDFATFHGKIYRAQIEENDELGPWVRVADDVPLARGHVHQLPTYQGRIYSVAGRTAEDPPNYLSSDEVWVGTVGAPAE